jgi:uncharacterized membrane protein YraQ (UPF0718 family)
LNWRSEGKPLTIILAIFLAAFYLPVGIPRFDNAITESLALVKWYAREHVILCLVPAFFIAGAISVFVSQASVMKYLGAGARKLLAYAVASVSGTVLAVCSCTVLPLFAGIYRMGAGLGPATAFLYAGPAINVLAIILTARILGVQIGIARAVGAIVFSVVIGLLMHLFFRQEEQDRIDSQVAMPEPPEKRPLWQTVIYFGSMVAILVFANWGEPEHVGGLWSAIYKAKWWLTGAAASVLGIVLVIWYGLRWWKLLPIATPPALIAAWSPGGPLLPFGAATVAFSATVNSEDGELKEWLTATWGFAKQILPLLLLGVLAAGLLLGRPGHEGLIPSQWVARAVGGNSLGANLFASVAGAFMYFATLTEVPILQGLVGAGMGQGPALALLLAGPALSLPSILVLHSIMGLKKTAVFIVLVVIMATTSGLIFGAIAG